ncbi:hypothetical protein EVAR_81224_1 [Eumeta japonica]|uniref:Uncharacterized protein n=1 Tax=Eumeta variegata TaxID=151549 RepID=A0A4C1V2A7_EUMVA|nr:hypothetical protein EVAR_81224_1 [Eumeta japonica]
MCFAYVVLDFYKFVIRIFTADWDNWLHRMIRYKTVPLALAVIIVAYGIAEICISQIKSTDELKAAVAYTPDVESSSNGPTTNAAELDNQNGDSVKIMTNYDRFVEISSDAEIQ